MIKTTREDELELSSIDQDIPEVVHIPKSKDTWLINWLKDNQIEKLSLLELESGIEATSSDTIINVKKRAKFLSKAASYCLLSGVKMYLFHWILWRYLYYIKNYSSDQLLPIIQIAKKKATPVESYLGMVLVGQMKNTNPMLTAEEQQRFQAELISAQNQPLEKSMDGL